MSYCALRPLCNSAALNEAFSWLRRSPPWTTSISAKLFQGPSYYFVSLTLGGADCTVPR